MTYKRFILDVDGILNDGILYWGFDGKPFKAFGSYDSDILKVLKEHIHIEFVTADKVGWEVTYSRITKHMGFTLSLVKEHDRYDWVMGRHADPKEVIFMGDGPYDAPIIKDIGLGIAPSQAWRTAIANADYVTTRAGGHGAVAEAGVYIMDLMGIKHEF